MPMNDLSDQTNTQIKVQTVTLAGHSNIGAEGIKPTELHACAVGEDANNETNEVGISVS